MSLSPTPAASERARPRFRIDLVDVARGVAIVAMVIFHAAYDLSTYRLIATDVAGHPGWRLFAGAIGGSFLTLVGISLVLAARKGLDWPAFLRRLALVAGGAALVTLTTYLWMPDFFVFFGILHLIAVASVLALPFLALPPAATLAAAALCFALPWLVAHPALDTSWLLWTGLSRQPVDTADYYPLLPWFGFVLAGVGLARIALATGLAVRLAAWRADSRPARLLSAAGRHSLAIYLIHQPILIGIVAGAAMVLAPAGPAPDAATQNFLRSCMESCTRAGQPAEICEEACACTADRLKRDDLWRQALSNRMNEAERAQVAAIARACYRLE